MTCLLSRTTSRGAGRLASIQRSPVKWGKRAIHAIRFRVWVQESLRRGAKGSRSGAYNSRLERHLRRTTLNQEAAPCRFGLSYGAHLRRWTAKGIARKHFVEWNGRPFQTVTTSIETAVRLAKLPGRSRPKPRGTPPTPGSCAPASTSGKRRDFWPWASKCWTAFDHHHPDHLGAAHFVGYRPREKLAIPLVGASRRSSHPIEIIGGPAGLEPATRPL